MCVCVYIIRRVNSSRWEEHVQTKSMGLEGTGTACRRFKLQCTCLRKPRATVGGLLATAWRVRVHSMNTTQQIQSNECVFIWISPKQIILFFNWNKRFQDLKCLNRVLLPTV